MQRKQNFASAILWDVINAQQPCSRQLLGDEERSKEEQRNEIGGKRFTTQARSAKQQPVLTCWEKCHSTSSSLISSFRAAGKCAPENELWNETKVVAIGALAVKRCVREISQYSAATCGCFSKLFLIFSRGISFPSFCTDMLQDIKIPKPQFPEDKLFRSFRSF